MHRLLALIALAACAAPRSVPAPPSPPPAPAPVAPAAPPAGPHGAREVQAIEGSAGARPAHVQLAGGAAVVALEPVALQVVAIEGGATAGTLELGPAPDVVVDRLLATAAPGSLRAAIGLAGEGHATRVVGGEKVRRAEGLRPCAIAGRDGEAIVLAERLPPPGSGSADVLLVRGKGKPVPLGQHAVGDLCAAAPRKAAGYLVAWMDVRGRLLVRPIEASGRAAGATSALPVPKGDRLVSPAMAALPGGGALVVGTSKKDGAVRGFLVNDRGRPTGAVLAIAPPHPRGPTGGAAIAALPGGGFAVAWHAARLDEEGAPTSLQLAFLDAAGKPEGEPILVLEPLALAPDPAALAPAADGAFVAAIVSAGGGQRAHVVHVPRVSPGVSPSAQVSAPP